MLTVIRRGTGNGSGGGSKAGWKPPTLTTNSGSSPQATSRPISPVMVRKTIRESNSEAKKYSRLRSNSIAPAKLTCSLISGASSVGSTTLSTPTMAMLPGISMITPTEAVISAGVPQPILTIGPTRNVPCLAGKKARRSLRIRGALATTSRGNITDSTAPLRTPSIRAGRFIVRLTPSSPPTPSSTKPKPSWIPPGNSAVMTISIENPGEPSGLRVVISPIAATVRKSAMTSSRAPAYSPRSVSMNR